MSNGVVYKDEPWHKECFICTECKSELASIPFMVREDKPFCKDCFTNLFANKCETCQKPITGMGCGSRIIPGTKPRFVSLEQVPVERSSSPTKTDTGTRSVSFVAAAN